VFVGANYRPSIVQNVHGNFEALALFAQQILYRYFHVVKMDFLQENDGVYGAFSSFFHSHRRVAAFDAHFLFRWTACDTPEFSFHNEGRYLVLG
jgi:hypothetical protein